MGLDQNNSIIARLHKLSYCLLFAFPALPNALQSIVFASFLLSIILNSIVCKEFFSFGMIRSISVLFLCGYYVFYLISFLYESSKPFQSSLVQSSILLAVVPIILVIFNYTISDKLRQIAVWVFTLSCLYLMVLLTNYWVEGVKLSHFHFKDKIAFGNYEEKHILQYIYTTSSEFITSVSQWGYFQENRLIELNTHHTYISAVLILNIIFILSHIRKTDKAFFILVKITGVICFSFFVFYLDSKVNVFLLCMLYACVFLDMIWQKSRIIFSLLILSLILTALYEYPIIANRFNSTLTEESIRFNLYKKTFPLVRDNFYTGVGANNVSCIVDSLMSMDSSTYNYNFNSFETLKSTHSQYLHYQLSGGVFLLIGFLAMGIFILYKLRGSILAINAMFIVLFNCIFEDFLSRAWGVYTFMLILIYYWSIIENKQMKYG